MNGVSEYSYLFFSLGLVVGGGISCFILKRGVWKMYHDEVKAHAKTLTVIDQRHKRWAAALKPYGITLWENGKSIEPMEEESCPGHDEWPEELI